MNQIKCPNCGEVFTIDENSYASIVDQIKNDEFERELALRIKTVIDKNSTEIELLKQQYENDKNVVLANKDKEIEKLKHERELLESSFGNKLTEQLLAKDEEYRGKQEENKSVVQQLQDQIKQLQMEITIAKNERESALKTIEATKDKELKEALSNSQIEIANLKNQIKANEDKAKADLLSAKQQSESEKNVLLAEIKNKDTEKELAVSKAVSEVKEIKDEEIAKANQKYELLRIESESKSETMKNSYEEKLSGKDRIIAEKQQQVDFYKDLKTKMSTKMIGETLEQHCSTEFNRNRMGMFPRAYFEKDNDARTGSKGDFIFRDYDEDSTEIISIMFEMKNEADTTATKHKNEDFFKELDKDRNEKGCEYAILVSLLESDNELYNEGIVDVSYRYPKMYVIRPQFFIPIITLLRNAALNSASWKKKYEIERSNNLDVTHFEENMETFKNAFGKNYELASRKFQDAIDDIDKTIKALEKTRADLVSSDRNLRLANDKAQGLTIKKLTNNAPSVAKKIEEARNTK